MASMIAGGLFNAVAFAGAGFLFKFIDKDKHSDETKRHNLATEKLNAAKEKWYENNIEKKDEIARMKQELSNANADINTTNKALDALRKITHEGRTFTREPNISDYYTPSPEMKEYMYIFIGMSGLAGGWAIHKFIY